jgi:hypothetical protein
VSRLRGGRPFTPERVSVEATKAAEVLSQVAERFDVYDDPVHADLCRRVARSLLKLAFDSVGAPRPVTLASSTKIPKADD